MSTQGLAAMKQLLINGKMAVLGVLLWGIMATGTTPDRGVASRIDAYLEPYVQTGNFSGVALVEKNGKVVFEKAYGFRDREHRVRNKIDTRFHVASLSMQFTAAAILRLVDQGAIGLDSRAGEDLHGISGAEKITVRDLLTERSGLPDINERPDYSEILQEHQTPSSLVEKIEGHALLFTPGSQFLHEEHSAYNLLALLLEKATKQSFAVAMQRVLSGPAGLKSSGVDDDSLGNMPTLAIGYQPEGLSGLKAASAIHWSAKSGNGSAYTTVSDEAKFIRALFEGHLLNAASKQAIMENSPRVGYGWFRGPSARFSQTAYYSNGRAPGFASFALYLPREQLTVVVFSNVYSSATTTIGYDLGAIALDLPYASFQPSRSPADPAQLKSCTGKFQFGSDFYQPNAKIALVAQGPELSLRWPSGDISPLIPLDKDHFVDRSYWEDVLIDRDRSGQPLRLHYGRFAGTVTRD